MEQDQQDEIEAISAIFVEEYSEIALDDAHSILETQGWADKSVQHVIRLALAPQPDDNDLIHVGAVLVCAMTVGYPAESALLTSFENQKGLSNTHLEELAVVGRKTAEENVGMPSIFTVAEAAKEWLQLNNLPGLDGSMYSDMIRRMQHKEVEKKQESEKAAIRAAADSEKRGGEIMVDEAELERTRRRQAGTMVTVETFMAWKKAFDEEMAAKRVTTDAVQEDKLSGKQWFQSQGMTTDVAAEDALLAAADEEVGEEEEGDEDYVPGESEEDEDEEEDDEDYEEES